MDDDEYMPPIDEAAAFIKEIDLSKPLPIDIEALQALKFESEDPTEAARCYREEGNYDFKRREFESARTNYTEGIKAGCTDSEVLAVLHTNRAAAEFQLQNYGSCLRDCTRAKQLKPDHYKAHERGARALLALERHADAVAWCDAALGQFVSDPALLRAAAQARALATGQAAGARKAAATGRRADRRLAEVARTLAERGVRIRPGTGRLEMPDDADVVLDEQGRLHYPVLLLYPEFGQTDFLRDVEESATLAEVAATVLDPSQQPAGWNANRAYTPDSVQFYLERDRSDSSGSSSATNKPPSPLDMSLSLAQLLTMKEDSGEQPAALTGSVLLLTVLRPGSSYLERWLREWWAV